MEIPEQLNDDCNILLNEIDCNHRTNKNVNEVIREQATLIKTSNFNNNYQGCPPINIEFMDLTYTVPVGKNGE